MGSLRSAAALAIATLSGLPQPSAAELRLELSLDRTEYVVGETAIATVTVQNETMAPVPVFSMVDAHTVRLVDEADRPLFRPQVYVRPLGPDPFTLAPGESRTETFTLEIRAAAEAGLSCGCLHEETENLRVLGPGGTRAAVPVRVTRGSVADQAVRSLLERARAPRLRSREERAALLVELEDIVRSDASPALAPFARQELLRQYSVSNLVTPARRTVETLLREHPNDARFVRPALIRLYNLLDRSEARVILTRLSQEPTEAGRYAAQLLSQADLWAE